MAMPSRSSRRPKPQSRWPLAEPPPGLFPTRDDLLRLLAVLSIATAAAAACSLLNRRPKPFCESDPYAYAYDSCEPCPENGRCVDGKLECVQGFKKYGKICIEDGLISQTANKISQLLQLRICDEHARALCGQAGKILFQELDISNMADELLAKVPVGLSEDGIKVAKNRVLESARGFFETTLTHNKVEAFKCPELVAELHRPLTCQVRQWIFRNIIFVMTFCMLFAALLWILWNIYQRRALSKRAEEIYEQRNLLTRPPPSSPPLASVREVVEVEKGGKLSVSKNVCEILEDNAINAKIGNPECEPWVVTSWLRDHLLVPQERRNAVLWSKVEELILQDSRIDQYPKVIKEESKVVFEWQASGSLSAKIKKMQGATGKSRTGVGAIQLAEELRGSAGMESMANKSMALALPKQGSLDAYCVAQISSPSQQLINLGTPKKSGSTPFVGSSYTPCVDPVINPFEEIVFDDLDAAEEFYKTCTFSRVWSSCWSTYGCQWCYEMEAMDVLNRRLPV